MDSWWFSRGQMYKIYSTATQLKCYGTCAETRFRLSAKRTSPIKSAGRSQFSRLLTAEVCASAVVMLDTPCSEVVWRVLATYSIRQFPLHFPSRASPCAITFQTQSTYILSTLPICLWSRLRFKCDSTCAETGPRRILLELIDRFISIQPWRPGLAGTRAQSCDRYCSGTLHPGQVLGGSLPLLSPAFRRSHFSRQVPPSATTREILAARGGTVGEKDVR